MSRGRRSGAGFLWLFAALLFTACHAPRPVPALRLGHEADVLSLDPLAVSEAATHSVLSNIYEGLATFDPAMRLRPALAAGWSTPDEHTWQIRLREGVRFHDGTILSATDVKDTLDRARTAPDSAVKGHVFNLDRVEALDRTTLRIKTAKPDPLLMSRLTYVLIRRAVESRDGGAAPAGTGPYRFVRWAPGHFLEAEAFGDYWGGKPRIARVFFVPMEQGERTLAALKQGEVDLVRDVPEALEAQLRALVGVRVVGHAGLATNYLWFDARPTRDALPNPFSDRRVRQAVSLAIDRPRIVAELRGRGLPADQLAPKGVFGHVPGLPAPRFDRDRARVLLREAGYPSGFRTTLVFSGSVSGQTTVSLVKSMLAGVGIRVEDEATPWPRLVTRWRENRLPFFLAGWRFENGDAASFLRDCVYSRGKEHQYGIYNPGFSSPELDRLIDENDQVLGEERRLVQYGVLMRLAMEEMPVVPLYHRVDVYAASERVHWTPRLDGKLLAVEMALREP